MDSHLVLVAARLGPNLCLVRPATQAVTIPLLQLQQHRLEHLHLLVHRQGVQSLVALLPVCLVHLKPPLHSALPQLLELLHHLHLGVLLRPSELPQQLHLLVVSTFWVLFLLFFRYWLPTSLLFSFL